MTNDIVIFGYAISPAAMFIGLAIIVVLGEIYERWEFNRVHRDWDEEQW